MSIPKDQCSQLGVIYYEFVRLLRLGFWIESDFKSVEVDCHSEDFTNLTHIELNESIKLKESKRSESLRECLRFDGLLRLNDNETLHEREVKHLTNRILLDTLDTNFS